MAARLVLITALPQHPSDTYWKHFSGANSGVGLATAKVIASASQDYHVILSGRSLPTVEQAISAIQSPGIKGTLSALELNVTDQASIHAAASHIEKTYGRLDVLINNAGVGNRSSDIKTRMWACLETNAIGAALVSDAFRPLLFKVPSPYSVYVSSGAGSLERASVPNPQSLLHEDAYRASKAAMNMIAVDERTKHGPKGLNVYVMTPGFVVSNLRGTSEEERSGWGGAGDPDTAGKAILDIIEGRREGDAGKFLTRDGVYPW